MKLPKIKEQWSSIITKFYVVLLLLLLVLLLLYNLNGACLGVIKIGYHQAKLEYRI